MLRKIKLKKNPFYFATLLLASFPILPLKVEVYVIAVWFLTAIYEHFNFKAGSSRKNLKWFAAFTSLFIFYLVYSLLFEPSSQVFHKIETKVALFVVPLGFYLMRRPLTSNQLKNIIRVYQLACLSMALLIIGILTPKIISNWSLLTVESFNYTFRLETEKTSGVHPTYLTIMFLFSIYLEIKFFIGKNSASRNRYLVFSIVHIMALASITILLAARVPITSFLLILTFFSFLKSFKKGIIILIGSVSSFLLIVVFVPFVGNRFEEIINVKSVDESTSLPSSASLRMSIHQCSSFLVKENWILGVGIEKKQDLLNQCYAQFNNEELSSKNYNTHNQYFDIILTLGIVGFILFLLMVLFPLGIKGSLLFKPLLFFKLFIILCFLTENILSRQDGVVFFAFFNCLLTHYFWWNLKVDQQRQLKNQLPTE